MRQLHVSELTGKPRRKPGTDQAERLFVFQLKSYGLPAPELQHRFAKELLGREWRWDVCWPARKIAVEIQGGIWTRGAHGHPSDILRNMEKHNDAALLGWSWYQFTPEAVKEGGAVLFMQQVLMATTEEDLCHVRSRALLQTLTRSMVNRQCVSEALSTNALVGHLRRRAGSRSVRSISSRSSRTSR